MNEEIEKVDILSRMFHRLNLEQLKTMDSMVDAVAAYDPANDLTKQNSGTQWPSGTKSVKPHLI